MAGTENNYFKLKKGEVMFKNEINYKKSGSELTDTKKDIQKFIETLYGNNPNDGHLVIWTKQTRASQFFTGTEFGLWHRRCWRE